MSTSWVASEDILPSSVFNASLALLHDISIPFHHFSLIPFLADFRWLQGVEAGACKSLPFAHDDIEDLAKARQLKSYDELISHVSGQRGRDEGFSWSSFFCFENDECWNSVGGKRMVCWQV